MSEPDPLGYRDWRDDAPQRRRFAGQTIFGFVCGVGAVFISGFFFFMSNIYYSPATTTPSRFQTNTFNWQAPTLVTVIVFALLGGSMLLERRRQKRGFVVGALLGVGVMGLIDGICFFRSWG